MKPLRTLIMLILAPVTILAACAAAPASVAPVRQHSAAAAQALDQAQSHVQSIQSDVPAIKADAPGNAAVASRADAIGDKAKQAEQQVGVAKAEGAKVAQGVEALGKSLEDATERANDAEQALQDRARNRIEWALIGGGFLFWLAGAGLAYLCFKAGSIVRAVSVAVSGFVMGAGAFAAAVYFDEILLIGGATLIVAAVIGAVAGVLHYRKHMLKAKGGLSDAEEALWALGSVAKDAALGGAKNVITLADDAVNRHLRATLTEAQWQALKKGLAD